MTSKENVHTGHTSVVPSVVNLISLEKYAKNLYDQISEKSAVLKHGESLSYIRKIRGTDFRMDFYPKGLIARKDIPQRVKFAKDFSGRYGYRWITDYERYCRENIPGKEILEEIVQLDMGLSPRDHEMRFYYPCPSQESKRIFNYRAGALENYTRSSISFMLIRNPETEELLGLVGASRNQHDKNVLELGMEIAEEARGKGIAEASIEDLAGILKAQGTARIFEGNFLYTSDRKNKGCNELFNKKRREIAQGHSRWKNLELSQDPKDPECKKFIITL